MFKKLNFKTLLIVFGCLLGLVVVVKVSQHSRGDRNFKARFFEIDTAKVSTISIVQHTDKNEFKFVRNGKTWEMVKKNKTYKLENNAVKYVIDELANMKPDFVAAMEKSAWREYMVNDSMATHVTVEQAGKVVADFYVGKASFKQYSQTSYIRLADDDNVYAVNGMLAMTFNRQADDYRDKSMVRIESPASLTRIEFSYPDSSFTLLKDKSGWTINGSKADSAKVVSYLSSIASLYGSDFADDANISGNPIFTVKMEGAGTKPLELKAYAADPVNQYIVTSSMNTTDKFSGAKGDLARRIFAGLNRFKPESGKAAKTKGKK
jgi:hypothetical protein